MFSGLSLPYFCTNGSILFGTAHTLWCLDVSKWRHIVGATEARCMVEDLWGSFKINLSIAPIVKIDDGCRCLFLEIVLA